jgi:hypothetical protein
MVSFAHESTRYSSELMMTPAASRWWYLDGPAAFRDSGSETRRVTVVAYLDGGEWYFTPPNYDREWEIAHVTEMQRAADYRSQVWVDLAPGCPLEIRDLHISMNQKYLSLRDASFTLMNKSSKTIKAYGLALGRADEECFVTRGSPTLIPPAAASGNEKALGYSAYLYWCEGVSDRRLVIDWVTFADGTEWRDPRFLSDEHRQKCDQE